MKVLIPVPSASIPCIESMCSAYVSAVPDRIESSEPIFISGSSRVSGMLERDGIPFVRASVSAMNTTSAVAATVESFFLNVRVKEDRPVLVLPPFWWPVFRMGLSKVERVLADDHSVKMVQLSGWVMAHATGICGYALNGYSDDFWQIGSNNVCCPHVIDPTCPFMARPSEFMPGGLLHDMSHGAACQYLIDNNYGYTDNARVLFPKSVKTASDDGKPEPFVDVIGINRRYRNRCRDYDGEISSMSGIEFKSEFL